MLNKGKRFHWLIRTLHEIHVILFDGLPVPSRLFLFICTCFSCEHVWDVIGRNLARETPVKSGTRRELPLMNGTESRSMSALTMLRQCAADAEP